MISIKHLFITTLFLIITNTALAGVYKWTDANGKVHFSDKPHKNADEIKIKAAKPSGIGISQDRLKRQKELLNSYQNSRAEKQKQQQKINKRNDKISKRCKSLKNDILNYEDVDYLFTRNEDGKKKRLSRAQKKAETAKLKELYNEKCL